MIPHPDQSQVLPVPGPAPPDPAGPSVRAALVLLRALQAHGLGHLVLCPGSRSAPLAVAAALLEPHGLRLHTAIDERSAAFFALGLGRATGLPAAVVTTSGSAVAQLLPAAVEADHGTVPLLLLTADRPRRLKNCGANQSVNQEEFLACSCRWCGQGHGDGLALQPPLELEGLAAQALAAACGDGLLRPPGAVHLNLPFEEPLHVSAGELDALRSWLQAQPPLATAGVAGGVALEAVAATASVAAAAGVPGPGALDPDRPGVVVAGPWRGRPQQWPAHLEALRRWQRRSGWPVLADPLSGLRGQPGLELIEGYDLLLEHPNDALAVPQVLRLGPLPASRRLQRWLQVIAGPQLLITEADPRPLDPLALVVGQASGGLAAWVDAWPLATWQAPPAAAALARAGRWRSAEVVLQDWLEGQLAGPVPAGFREPELARRLARLLPPGVPVMLANSSPVRDWESFASLAGPRPIFGFRGASGIDGTLSIACGLAEALGSLVLVSGDLALLHDSNGWCWRQQLRGRLTVLLIDNGGGGIFEQLPIRTEPAGFDFERFFAMPQRVDPLALAAAHGVPARQVGGDAELAAALDWAQAQPLALLRLVSDRRADAALRQRLRTMAPSALVSPELP